MLRMHRIAVLGVMLVAGAIAAHASDTVVALTHADLYIRIPTPTVLQRGRWSLAQYSSADIYGLELSVPTPTESADPPTAMSATYGDSLHVFIGAVPEFLSQTDLLARLMDVHQLRRSSRGQAPIMMTYTAQTLIGAAPAEEVALELRDTTAADSLFTFITTARRGHDVVVVILRSRTNGRNATSWSADYYRHLLAAIEMPALLQTDTMHLVHPDGWHVVIPAAWTNRVTTRTSRMPLIPDANTEDTLWNTIVVQLPLLQIEYTAIKSTLSDTAAGDYAEHVAKRQGLEHLPEWSAEPVLRRWLWFRSLSPRRGDLVQTTYGVTACKGVISAVRLTAWQRDMEHIRQILPIVLRVFSFGCAEQ